MQLQAFNYSQVIKSFPVKITSITTYNDMIFVAGKKGTFIQYIRKNDRDTEYKSVYQIANHKENFSQCKSGATQLLIVPEWDTLFAVNDNGIARHNFSDFEYVETLPFSKGVTYICVDPKATLLAAICDKKVLIYVKDVSGFSIPKEISFNKEKVICLCATQRNIVAGTKTHYSMIDNLQYKIVKDISVDARSNSPLAVVLASSRDTMSRSSSSLSSLDNINIAANSAASAAPTSTIEILLRVDSKGIIYDFLGNPARNGGVQITWRDTPTACFYMEPYIVSIESRRIEIHNNWQLEMVQSIPLSKCKFYSSSLDTKTKRSIESYACLATESSIYEIQMKPIRDQIDELITPPACDFDNALYLCQLNDSTEYQSLQTAVKQRQAFYYFERKDYDRAMQCFQKAHASIDLVVSLIPSIEPDEKLPPGYSPQHLEPVEEKIAIDSIIFFLEARKTEITYGKDESLKHLFMKQKDTLEKVDNYLLKCYLKTSPSNVLTLLSGTNSCTIAYCKPLLDANNMEKELIQLYRSRQKHEEAVHILLKNVNDATIENVDQLYDQLVALKDYLTHLGQERFDIIKECEKVMYKINKELVLQMFMQLHPDPYFTPISIITIVSELKDLEKGNEIQPEPLYKINEMPIRYLKYMIETQEVEPRYYNDFAIILIESIIDIKHDPQYVQMAINQSKYYEQTGKRLKAGEEEGKLGELRRELLTFLETSTKYDPTDILKSKSLPENDLLEERATILSHLNRHEEALKLIVHKLRDIDYAERYCNQLIIRDPSFSTTIYITLVKICLAAPEYSLYTPEEAQSIAIEILTNHSQYIDPIHAIQLLPVSSSLSSLKSYLDYIFTSQTRKTNTLTMIKNLTQLEHDQIFEEYEYDMSSYKEVNSSTVCGVCKKPIGISVFCIYPNGTIVHQACSNEKRYFAAPLNDSDSTICPVTSTNFDILENHRIHKHKQ